MRESRLFIILISLVMGLAGCSKETMIGEYVDRCAVRLDIDWGPCGIDPDGMTVLFYPGRWRGAKPFPYQHGHG